MAEPPLTFFHDKTWETETEEFMRSYYSDFSTVIADTKFDTFACTHAPRVLAYRFESVRKMHGSAKYELNVILRIGKCGTINTKNIAQ